MSRLLTAAELRDQYPAAFARAEHHITWVEQGCGVVYKLTHAPIDGDTAQIFTETKTKLPGLASFGAFDVPIGRAH